MGVLVLLAVTFVLFVALLQVNGLAALIFLFVSLVSIPAIVIQRREATLEIPVGPDAESTGRGWMRLATLLSLDAMGVAIAVLLFLLLLLASHVWFGHHSH